MPLGLVIFAVIGLIIFGVATPTESAAVGALVCFILAFFYKGQGFNPARDLNPKTHNGRQGRGCIKPILN